MVVLALLKITRHIIVTAVVIVMAAAAAAVRGVPSAHDVAD